MTDIYPIDQYMLLSVAVPATALVTNWFAESANNIYTYAANVEGKADVLGLRDEMAYKAPMYMLLVDR